MVTAETRFRVLHYHTQRQKTGKGAKIDNKYYPSQASSFYGPPSRHHFEQVDGTENG